MVTRKPLTPLTPLTDIGIEIMLEAYPDSTAKGDNTDNTEGSGWFRAELVELLLIGELLYKI